jgi:uncharacterized protein
MALTRILRVNSLNIFSVMLGRRNKTLADRAAFTLPLRQADRLLTPAGVSWWQDWMDHAEPGDPWWEAIDYSGAARTMPPTAMVTGWYDIFLPWQLHDFEAAQNANRDVRITIGPWTHSAVPGLAESVRRSIELFQEKLANGRAEPTGVGVKPRVRLFLMGAHEWREYPSWPPPNTVNQIFYLHPSGAISGHAPVSESLSSFDYKPADPTPAFHGPMLDSRTGTGNMAELERRSDALVFTSAPFISHLDVVGPVSAKIFFRSNTEHTDFYVCLCDVTRGGHSINVCDGYRRLRPDQLTNQNAVIPTGTRKVNIEFWPTAYRFQSGHRMRIIIASGAHPRFARNPGSGEPLGDAITMVVAHQQIFHGPEHPSAITLAVMP